MTLSKRGLMIYEFFKKNPTIHPTAEEVYDHLKQKDVEIGVATVYRNLKTLVDNGYLKEINMEKQGVRYDLYDNEHYHFVCDACGHIDNFFLETLHSIDKAVEKETHGVVNSKDLLFHGTCEHCLQNKKL